ncbi:MAG: hypothetical protein ACOH18_05420 [Candidatus Saccharimonadaceae bacterium]
MEQYTLPDGRQPIRFGKGRTAYYAKLRGAGEVVYTFSMIKYMINNRPRLTDEALSTIAKKRANGIKLKDPDFFKRIGTTGGKVTKKSD